MRKYLIYFALLMFGCGGNGDGFSGIEPEAMPAENASPEISNLIVSPDTVMYMQGDGNVAATAEFSYSDDTLDIETMRVQMSDGNSQSVSLGAIDTASGTISEEFPVSTTELGVVTAEIWLIDAAGNESNRLIADIRVESAVPEITALDPAEVRSGDSGFNLSVTGTGFLPGATVTWDGTDRTTTYVSDTKVVAAIPKTDLTAPLTVSVRVRNP